MRSVTPGKVGRGDDNARPTPLPIAVLVSGTGTNLQALLDTVHGHEAQVVAVASGAPGALALERAAARGVPTAVFERSAYADRETRDGAMADWLAERGARLVVLAGYMELLTFVFLERFPSAVINVHPSLLPAFPGLHAIEQALAYGVKVFGVTVHFVDAGVDSGAVILQRATGVARRTRPRSRCWRRCGQSSTRCCPRRCACSRAGRLGSTPENPRRVTISPAPQSPLKRPESPPE